VADGGAASRREESAASPVPIEYVALNCWRLLEVVCLVRCRRGAAGVISGGVGRWFMSFPISKPTETYLVCSAWADRYRSIGAGRNARQLLQPPEKPKQSVAMSSIGTRSPDRTGLRP